MFYIFKFVFSNLETVLSYFKYFQFDFLPLYMIRMPFIGVINYSFNQDILPEETMVMIKNIPIFKIGKGNKKLLYIHGGGFISGDYMSFRTFCLEIYNRYNIYNRENKDKLEIWFPVYSLCPENNISKAIEELNYIYNNTHFSHIMADSAGGYLALNIKNIRNDTKVILISPVYDLKCQSDAYIKNYINDINFNQNLVKKIFTNIYHNINNNNIENIENIYIFVSKNELFIYDSYKIYSINNKAKLHRYDSGIHSLPLYWKYDQKAKNCLQDIVSFL